MNLLEIVQWPDAVVILKDGITAPMVRPAVLVYPTPDGFAWAEDGYMDPIWNGRNNFHRVVCTLRPFSRGYVFSGPQWHGRLEPFRPELDPGMARGFEWYAAELLKHGRSRRDEWARVHELARAELA